jgi:hypothetical protein
VPVGSGVGVSLLDGSGSGDSLGGGDGSDEPGVLAGGVVLGEGVGGLVAGPGAGGAGVSAGGGRSEPFMKVVRRSESFPVSWSEIGLPSSNSTPVTTAIITKKTAIPSATRVLEVPYLSII